MAGTIGAPTNGSHGELAPPPPAGNGSHGALRMVRAIAEAGALVERRPAAPVAAPRTPLPTREWLARAAFSLLAVTVVLAIVLTALSLLDGAEAAGLLMPVVALSAIVVGFYLGSEASAAGRR